MTDLRNLYTELGRLLVQAEILGTVTIPNQGQIGIVKKQISEQLNSASTKKIPVKPHKPTKKK